MKYSKFGNLKGKEGSLPSTVRESEDNGLDLVDYNPNKINYSLFFLF